MTFRTSSRGSTPAQERGFVCRRSQNGNTRAAQARRHLGISSMKQKRITDLPKTKLNKDIIKAWEGVKGLQYQMKDSDLPWAVELRNLPPLGEKTVPQWKKWIRAVFLANHNQHPEETAHAAKNIRNRDAIKNISDPDKRDAAVFDRLWNEMVVVEKGALTMLAKDLDRVRGL